MGVGTLKSLGRGGVNVQSRLPVSASQPPRVVLSWPTICNLPPSSAATNDPYPVASPAPFHRHAPVVGSSATSVASLPPALTINLPPTINGEPHQPHVGASTGGNSSLI